MRLFRVMFWGADGLRHTVYLAAWTEESAEESVSGQYGPMDIISIREVDNLVFSGD